MPDDAPPLVVIGADVLPMDKPGVLSDQTIVIRDGRIVAMGARASVPVPVGATEIDGTGRFLLPGLADMHAHLADRPAASPDPVDLVVRSQLLSYLATGVTLVRNMRGSDAHRDYRRLVQDGSVTGPRIFTTTNFIDGPDGTWSRSLVVTTADEARAAVEQAVSAGYDQVKVYHSLSPEAYAAIMETAARLGIRAVGHVPLSVGIDAALAARQYSIEHLRGYDFDGVRPEALTLDGGRNAERFTALQRMSPGRMRQLAAATASAGTWNCPTLVLDQMLFDVDLRNRILQDERIGLVLPEIRTRIDSNHLDKIFSAEAKQALRTSLPYRYQLVRMLQEAGAGLLVGTDTPVPFLVPGLTPIDEIQHLVAAGLSPFEALHAATAAPARFLGIAADSGTVAAGMRADLILLEANPLEDVSNLWRLVGVIRDGRWLARSTLEAELQRLVRSAPGPAGMSMEAAP
jgi:imidazolonepropionase-like amidohydrolase